MPSFWDAIGNLVDGRFELASKSGKTIQTHNAVSIPLSGWSTPSSNPTNHPLINSNGWIDTNGYDFVAVTVLNDATTGIKANVVWSNDGVTKHGETSNVVNVAAAANSAGDGVVQIRARYTKLSVNNIDSAAAHTMSAWMYLKA